MGTLMEILNYGCICCGWQSGCVVRDCCLKAEGSLVQYPQSDSVPSCQSAPEQGT